MLFTEQLLKGLGVAGWLIGFLAGMGVFLILVGIVVLAFQWLAQMLDNREDEKEAEHEHDVDD